MKMRARRVARYQAVRSVNLPQLCPAKGVRARHGDGPCSFEYSRHERDQLAAQYRRKQRCDCRKSPQNDLQPSVPGRSGKPASN